MKALLSRFNLGLSHQREKDRGVPSSREKQQLNLPKLPEWPPQHQENGQRVVGTHARPVSTNPNTTMRVTSAVDSVISVDKPLPTMPQHGPQANDTPSQHARPINPSISTVESSFNRAVSPQSSVIESKQPKRHVVNGSIISSTATESTQKKVAFIPEQSQPVPIPVAPAQSSLPAKTTVSRFQATQGGASVPKEPSRSSTSFDGGSKVDLSKSTTSKATSTRTVGMSPYPQSMRANTPYSQMSNTSSRILAASSWSEGAEDDLVSNLGPRERTRQEVLWEIVASEERYVVELLKMKETFIDPILHPFASVPPPQTDFDDFPRYDTPLDYVEVLPIASRFMSPTSFLEDGRSEQPHIDDEDGHESDERFGQPVARNNQRSPYKSIPGHVVFPTRSHNSLPPPPRNLQQANANQSVTSLHRQPSFTERERRTRHDSAPKPLPTTGRTVLQKLRKPNNPAAELPPAPGQLPEALRVCLEVVETGILDGHLRLSEGLRKRYDEQYPLVRSLADVFVSNSQMFRGYATYVLHLERALEHVHNALSDAAAAKKPKNQDAADWVKVCKFLSKLEQSAADKGETGLAISLSKPFQRLLKYPLLFQNLLYHTDPSTFEYESTLQMVAEVEMIVRSIEDEKIQKEDRDKTRDVWARIEGLEKVRELAIPKMSRILVEERSLNPAVAEASNSSPQSKNSPSSYAGTKGNVKGKSSFKRLSGAFSSNSASSGIGGKKDIWLVRFNDVALQCQRTGTTTLPLVSDPNFKATSLGDGKSKNSTQSRRNTHTRPRNMYKFIKIETWAIGDSLGGAVNMDDVAKTRSQMNSLSSQPQIIPMPDDDEDGDGGDSDDSDKKSKMSFSYWGADKVTIQKPIIKPRQPSTLGANRRVSPSTTGGGSYGRESSANAKFGTRLVANETSPGSTRSSSRRTNGGATPVASTTRRPTVTSDEGSTARSTVTRPEWNSNTRSTITPRAITPTSANTKRTRNTSQATAATAASNTKTFGSGRAATAENADSILENTS